MFSRPCTWEQTPLLSAIFFTLLRHLSLLGWGLGSALRVQDRQEAGEVFSTTHREAERLLETKPEGCYLVRFSESAVTFVLTYR